MIKYVIYVQEALTDNFGSCELKAPDKFAGPTS